MCAKLLILESPGKVKKVQSFLGPDWKVVASVGHVRDLPVKEMGVAAPDFKPHYQPTERGADVLKRLGALAKQADVVYLATDPDREGEAIAWHVADALKLKDAKRVTYGEITESAVKAAVQSPRAIDMALVAAQEGRRVLDRFCGYCVRPALPRRGYAPFCRARPESGLTVGGRTGTGNHFLCECHALRGGTEL
ncbi:MAG: toprim domain-containing protein [Bilophila wadsworthia]